MSLVRPYNRPVAEKVITDNRRARHEYHLLERHEAGMVLTGTEVKSLRQGRITLGSAYADVRDGELWLIGVRGFKTRGSTVQAVGGGAMRASANAAFLRLPRLLGCVAVTCWTTGERVRQRRRVARLAPPARSARTASGSSFVPASRSRLPRCARPAPATAASARAERHSPDSSALAPAAGATQVDAAAATSRPSTPRRSRATARATPRARESALGLFADRGRAAEARLARVVEQCGDC